MPKLRTQEFWYDNETQKNLKFKVDFHVNTSSDFFFYLNTIPKELLDFSKEKTTYMNKKDAIVGKDVGHCVDIVKKLVRDFREFLQNKTSRKVILYRFQLQGEIKPDSDPENHDFISDAIVCEDISRLEKDALGLTMEWHIRNEVTLGGQTKYMEENGDRHRDFDSREWKVMDWSKSREEWFKSTQFGFQQLLQRVYAMNDLPDELFIAKIDKGHNMLEYKEKP